MILYHGTCDAFVPEILREGLIPQKHMLLLTVPNIDAFFYAPEHNHKAVYLSGSLATARLFAKFRADYEKAKYHAVVMFGHATKLKLSHTVRPTAKPVVLTINVPDDWKTYIKPDDNTPTDMLAYWTVKPIPAKYIKGTNSEEKQMSHDNLPSPYLSDDESLALAWELRHSTAPQCECELTQAENPVCRNHRLSDTARLIAVLNPTDKEGRL